MEKLTDEELDSVFKNAAEGLTQPFDAAAWDAMAKKLNAPRPVPVWRRWIPLLVLGITLFTGGVWVGRSTNRVASDKMVETIVPIGENTNGGNTQNEKSNQSLVTKAEENITQSTNQNQRETVTEVYSNDHSKNTEAIQYQAEQLRGEAISEVVQNKIIDSGRLNDIGNESDVADAEKKIVDSVLLSKPEADSLEVSTKMNRKPEGKKRYGLFIRLLASPDLSSIRFGPTQLGSNVGVMGEFAFMEHVSVSTGILWAKKNYESYQAGTYGAGARHLTGSCSILDIPVNLTYFFPSQNRFSIYVTAGASSYLMLREDYVYTVKSNTGDHVYPYQAIRKNNEWFKVLNLAVGMQYPLTARWQIQLEPFIKAPLADLGERKVRLSSLGVFGGLRYQLNTKNKTP